MADPPKNPAAQWKSLYPELLQAERATISAAPVRYDTQKAVDEDAQQQQKKKKDASLQFQPIKRPQQPQQKKKQQHTKPGYPSYSSSSLHKSSSSVNTASASSPPKSVVGSTPSIQRSTFEDWVADEDDEYYYMDRPKAQRGGRKKNKKNKAQEVRTWAWDDIYDPSRPNVYADYKGSEEQHREVKDWKSRLYHRQLKEARKAKKASSSEDSDGTRPMNRMFAPPSQQMSFAPPTFDDRRPSPPVDDDDYYPPPSNGHRAPNSSDLPVPAPAASVPDDATGEDAYLRRMRMSGMASSQSPPAPSRHIAPSAATPPAPVLSVPLPPPPVGPSQEERKAQAEAAIAAMKAKILNSKSKPDAAPDATVEKSIAPTIPPTPSETTEEQPPPPPPPPPPPQEPGVVISRAPVRYDLPQSTSVSMDQDIAMDGGNGQESTQQSKTEQTQSGRPSKKGLGERLLKKYGWEKGQGLGAQGEGITTALIAKADKRKKRSDAEGGGWAAPANMGKIVGGKRRKIEDDTTSNDARHPSTLSSVIKLEGMLVGLDVQKEIEDNNLMQEIGEDMTNNYGNVERVFIWRVQMGGANEVFVKFTSQLSALRAKDGMDGTTFAGNAVQAAFWDEEMFERGEYGS